MAQEINSIKDFKTFDTFVVSTTDRPLPEIIQFCQEKENRASGVWNHGFKLKWVNDILKTREAEEPGIVENSFTEYLEDSCYSELLVLRPKFAFNQSDIDFMDSFINKAKYDKLGLLYELIRFTSPLSS